jgi:hypothetical protein
VVVDKALTEEAHQRRGLGTVVMRTLQNLAVDQGGGRFISGSAGAWSHP